MNVKNIAISLLLFTIIIGMILSFSKYSGSKLSLTFFHFSFIVLLLAIVHRQHLYVLTFTTAFLFLGFWAKFIFYHFFNYEFVEPIGAFNSSSEFWDRVLLVVSAGVIGFALPKILFSIFNRDSTRNTIKQVNLIEFYRNHCIPIWFVFSIIYGLVYAWNYQAGFFQIGVKPKVILPLHLNAFLAWLVNYGLFYFIAMFVKVEIERSQKNLEKYHHYVIVAGLIGSLSILSRSFFIFVTFPFLLVTCVESKFKISKMAWSRLTVSFIVFLGLSLLSVQTIRSEKYFLTMQSDVKRRLQTIEKQQQNITERSDTHIHIVATDHTEINKNIKWMEDLPPNVPKAYRSESLEQISSLFLGRWTGLEGVLAVSAYEKRGLQLLIDGMLESPKKGNSSLYQGIAQTEYSSFDNLIFLTLPGIIAVLFYSDSLAIVFLGMLVISLIMILTESAINKYINNSYLSALTGIQTAYVVCQLTYPYLCMIYFFQLWIFIVFVCAAESIVKSWTNIRTKSA